MFQQGEGKIKTLGCSCLVLLSSSAQSQPSARVLGEAKPPEDLACGQAGLRSSQPAREGRSRPFCPCQKNSSNWFEPFPPFFAMQEETKKRGVLYKPLSFLLENYEACSSL